MRVKDLFEKRSNGMIEGTIEIMSEDESVEVDVEFYFDVEPTEYEGNYTFYQGGVNLEDAKIKPFKFQGKQHTDVTPDLVKYLALPVKLEQKYKSLYDKMYDKDDPYTPTKAEADKVINDLLDHTWDQVQDGIEVPSKHYPMSR